MSMWRFLLACGMFATVKVSQATQFTWDGGGSDSNWATGANWVGDSFSEGGSPEFTYLKFSGTTRLNNTNNKGAGTGGFNVGQIDFLAGAGAFILNQLSGEKYSFDMLGTDGNGNKSDWASVNNYSTSTQTVNIDFISRTDFTQGIEFNTGAGDIIYSGHMSKGGKLRKTGTGTLTLSNSNTYSGGTFIGENKNPPGNVGTVNVTASGALGSSGVSIISGSRRSAQLTLNSAPGSRSPTPSIPVAPVPITISLTISPAITGSVVMSRSLAGEAIPP